MATVLRVKIIGISSLGWRSQLRKVTIKGALFGGHQEQRPQMAIACRNCPDLAKWPDLDSYGKLCAISGYASTRSISVPPKSCIICRNCPDLAKWPDLDSYGKLWAFLAWFLAAAKSGTLSGNRPELGLC